MWATARYDREEAALGLIRWLEAHSPERLCDRYQLRQEILGSPGRILEEIALQRGLLTAGGKADRTQAADAVLWDLRRGRRGSWPLTHRAMQIDGPAYREGKRSKWRAYEEPSAGGRASVGVRCR